MFQEGTFVACNFDKKCLYCRSKKKKSFNIPIACISLKDSKNRGDIEKQYHKFGWCQIAGFWIVERHPEGGKRGCFESHRAINHYFKQQKYKKAIILEDDVKFISKLPNYINKLPKNAYILYLSWYPSYINGLKSYNIVDKHFLQGPFLTTHAYVTTPKLMSWMEKLSYKNQHIDQVLSTCLSENSYGLSNIIAVQKNGLASTINSFDIYKYIDKENFMLSTSKIISNTKCNINVIIIILIILILIIIIIVIIILYKYNYSYIG